MQIDLNQVQTELHLVFSRVLLSYLFSIFFVFTWLLTDDDSRPVFIKAGCDRNHPKVDFCPYDNPALTRLDRLLGPSWHHQYLLSCPAEWWRFRVHLSRDMLVSCSQYNISLPMSFTKGTPSPIPTSICLLFYLDPELLRQQTEKFI